MESEGARGWKVRLGSFLELSEWMPVQVSQQSRAPVSWSAEATGRTYPPPKDEVRSCPSRAGPWAGSS